MTAYGIYEVVRALIGEITPSGDSAIDRKREINMLKLTVLTDALLLDVKKVAILRNKPEASVQSAGETAYKVLDRYKREIAWLLAAIDEDGAKNG